MRTREQEDEISSHILLKAIANACRVEATFVSNLTESEVSDECEKQYNEDEELEQLLNGQICFKVYPFSNGMVIKRWVGAILIRERTFLFLFLFSLFGFCLFFGFKEGTVLQIQILQMQNGK